MTTEEWIERTNAKIAPDFWSVFDWRPTQKPEGRVVFLQEVDRETGERGDWYLVAENGYQVARVETKFGRPVICIDHSRLVVPGGITIPKLVEA